MPAFVRGVVSSNFVGSRETLGAGRAVAPLSGGSAACRLTVDPNNLLSKPQILINILSNLSLCDCHVSLIRQSHYRTSFFTFSTLGVPIYPPKVADTKTQSSTIWAFHKKAHFNFLYLLGTGPSKTKSIGNKECRCEPANLKTCLNRLKSNISKACLLGVQFITHHGIIVLFITSHWSLSVI